MIRFRTTATAVGAAVASITLIAGGASAAQPALVVDGVHMKQSAQTCTDTQSSSRFAAYAVTGSPVTWMTVRETVYQNQSGSWVNIGQSQSFIGRIHQYRDGRGWIRFEHSDHAKILANLNGAGDYRAVTKVSGYPQIGDTPTFVKHLKSSCTVS